MTIFEAVKTTVAPRMAAEHFGLSVSQNGMVCCPFHDDRHPSMKLYEDHYHCFGCQANGDVIAFTSKLFGNICTFCRIGKRGTHRRHRRRSRMTVSWKPVICSNVRSICWIC